MLVCSNSDLTLKRGFKGRSEIKEQCLEVFIDGFGTTAGGGQKVLGLGIALVM